MAWKGALAASDELPERFVYESVNNQIESVDVESFRVWPPEFELAAGEPGPPPCNGRHRAP